ncbi:DUF7507 domain-containing protein [Microbacterium sp. E-13]|uniref:DUF7507 domain-containing protein n=1 Tax=Microbacterium sp. E-13 TaxID=3404048 RepID=UPI003CFAB2D9
MTTVLLAAGSAAMGAAPAQAAEVDSGPPPAAASYTLAKSAAETDVNKNGITDMGDEVAYSFLVSNTGTVTLTDVAVDDSLLAGVGVAVTCDPSVLAPGESVTCVADGPYVITQADVDAGGVTNVATGSVTVPPGVPAAEPQSDQNYLPTDQASAIRLVKQADKSQLVVGDTITYTFTTTNVGNTTLTEVEISENVFTGTGTPPVIGDCNPADPATLAPGEVMSCTATYVVTQADVDSGRLDNTALVSSLDPQGNAVTATSSRFVEGPQNPLTTLLKSSQVADVNGNGITDVGDEVAYSFLVSNTGNVTLTDVAVDDSLLGGFGITVTCDPSVLAPGESVTCVADDPYVITQADVDAGQVENTATATGTTRRGTEVESNPSSTIVPTDRVPAIELVKDVDATEFVADDTITYTFTATNTGNTTLTDVTISETGFTGSGSISALTCDPAAPAVLAPGAQLVCTATYVVSQADVDAGSVENTAQVTGVDPKGDTVTDTDDAFVPADRAAAYTLVKSSQVADVNSSGITDVGDEVAYSFLVSNTGTVTLTDVAVDDSLLAAFGITVTCDPSVLAPGESVTCAANGPYVITQADVDAGGVTNVATGSVVVPPGVTEPEPPTDENFVPTDGVSAIELVKDADATELVADDTVTYTFTATNTGTTTLTDVTISETGFTGSGSVSAVTCDPAAPAVLAPGAQLVCTATYVVTPADVDAGSVENTAQVTGVDPKGETVTDTDDALVPASSVPLPTPASKPPIGGLAQTGVAVGGSLLLAGLLLGVGLLALRRHRQARD